MYYGIDPQLQRWVVLCLYWGAEDVWRMLHPERCSDAELDDFYEYSKRLLRLSTTRKQDWPATRTEFFEEWKKGLERVQFDEKMRTYLMRVARVEFAPWYLRWTTGRLMYLLNRGFLAPEIRAKFDPPWSEADERRYQRRRRTLYWINRLSPHWFTQFPIPLALWIWRRKAVKNGWLSKEAVGT